MFGGGCSCVSGAPCVPIDLDADAHHAKCPSTEQIQCGRLFLYPLSSGRAFQSESPHTSRMRSYCFCMGEVRLCCRSLFGFAPAHPRRQGVGPRRLSIQRLLVFGGDAGQLLVFGGGCSCVGGAPCVPIDLDADAHHGKCVFTEQIQAGRLVLYP